MKKPFFALIGHIPTIGEVFEGMVKHHIGHDARITLEDFKPADVESFRAILAPIVKHELDGPIADMLKAADAKELLAGLQRTSAEVAEKAVTRYLQSLMPAQ